MDTRRIVKKVTDGEPCSSRPVGRPRLRWLDQVEEDLQKIKVRNWREKFNPLKPELNPICYLLTLLGVYHFLHVSRIKVKLLTFRLLMSYIYGAPILDVSRSHTTQHSR